MGKALQHLGAKLPPEWQHVIPKVEELIHDLPMDGSKVFHQLWKELPARTTQPDEKRTPLEKLRDLVLRFSQDWERYIEFDADPGIPWTNNRTEQTIGRWKNRAKRVRGNNTGSTHVQPGRQPILVIDLPWFVELSHFIPIHQIPSPVLFQRRHSLSLESPGILIYTFIIKKNEPI